MRRHHLVSAVLLAVWNFTAGLCPAQQMVPSGSGAAGSPAKGSSASQFGFGGGSFAVQTDNPSRDSALVALGLDADLNRTVKIFADYEVQAGQSNYFGQSIDAGLKIGF